MSLYILEDDKGWELYYRRVLKEYDTRFFKDGVEAIAAMDEEVPELVILDVLLTGPTGFAVLNEMKSYPELACVPVIVISSIAIKNLDEAYGVVKVFDKSTMMPKDLQKCVKKYMGKNGRK